MNKLKNAIQRAMRRLYSWDSPWVQGGSILAQLAAVILAGLMIVTLEADVPKPVNQETSYDKSKDDKE